MASFRSLGIISSLKLSLKLTIETSYLALKEIFSFWKVRFDIMCIYMTYDHICVYQYVSDSSYRFLCCDCGLKKMASQPHSLPVCMLHGSEVQHRNIHFAGSQFLCGNARHHLRIVFSVMLSVLIFLSYTMGLGLGQSWAFSFMIGKLPHTHIISEYHRFMMI